MLEIACENVVFHFNKKHLTDATIPMWIVKTKGESYYVEHVTCNVPWSTKETPDNTHTKGSIKIKDCLLRIGGDNHAVITQLTDEERIKYAYNENKPLRIIFSGGFEKILKENNIDHSEVVTFYGGCGERYYVCDILDQKAITYLTLKHNNEFRSVKENEEYYDLYDEKVESKSSSAQLT